MVWSIASNNTVLGDSSNSSLAWRKIVKKMTLCQLLIHWKHGRSQFYISLTTAISLLSPHAVICCRYFINVLLAVTGLKAAKQHIINWNKWKAAGCVCCFTGSRAAALEVTQNVKTSLSPVADYISDLSWNLLQKACRWWCPVQLLRGLFFPFGNLHRVSRTGVKHWLAQNVLSVTHYLPGCDK